MSNVLLHCLCQQRVIWYKRTTLYIRKGLFSMPSGQGAGPDCCLHLRVKWQFRVPSLLVPGQALEGAAPGDYVVLLGEFNAHIGNSSETWRGVIERNGFKDLNLSGFLCLDFCANHSLSVSQTSDTGGKMQFSSWLLNTGLP